MKLVASLMVGPGEEDRYLSTCIEHLNEFCDEIRVRWEGDQGTNWEPGDAFPNLHILNAEPSFFQHEGRARQQLLDFTLQAKPDIILAVDADEFVTDGPGLRTFLEGSRANVFTLSVQEVWKAEPDQIGIRIDGGWRPSEAPILYRVPVRQRLRINDRALACGREPVQIRNTRHRQHTGHSLLHFGWTNEADRQARYERYAVNDGGRYHRNTHIESIMFPDDKVKLTWKGWDGVAPEYREPLMERANRGAGVVLESWEKQAAAVKELPLTPSQAWEQRFGDGNVWAYGAVHPDDGRWVGIRWDGTVEHG